MSVLACLLVAVAAARAAPDSPSPAGTRETLIPLPGFGDVRVYAPEPLAKARGVVLFVSGDGGWNLGVVDMARRLSGRAVVAGLSMPAWQKRIEKGPSRCWYPAGELEAAAQALEKRLGLPRYVAPILVGYSSGATVVYGALAQAPATAFAGAVSLGFCPDLEVARPLCGSAAWKPSYDATKHTGWLPESPGLAGGPGGAPRWQVLQGDIDQVCDSSATATFVRRIPAAHLVALPKVGHGFSVPSRWGASFDDAVDALLQRDSIASEPAAAPKRLPLVDARSVQARLASLDLPLEVSWPDGATAALVLVSGDGGWSDLDQAIAAGLGARGIAVVGLNALRYFWRAKTPAGLRSDLGRILGVIPTDTRVFAGGYSFGAETVPVALARDALLDRLSGLVLIAPGPFATFEVSPLDWLSTSERSTPYPVGEALRAMTGRPVLCLVPSKERDSGCPTGEQPGLDRREVEGGHHFGGTFDGLVEPIAAFVTAAAGPETDR